MAMFHSPDDAAPQSLEGVLNSLQSLLDNSKLRPQHSLVNSEASSLADSSSEAEMPLANVSEILHQHIPVLNDEIPTKTEQLSFLPPSEAEIEQTLNQLREQCNGIVADLMLTMRERLEKQQASPQEVIEKGLKDFLDELSSLRSR